MNDEVEQLARPFFLPSTLLPAADLEAFAKEWFSAKRSVEKLQGVVNPVAKKWQCGADIPVCFFLVKQEGRVSG